MADWNPIGIRRCNDVQDAKLSEDKHRSSWKRREEGLNRYSVKWVEMHAAREWRLSSRLVPWWRTERSVGKGKNEGDERQSRQRKTGQPTLFLAGISPGLGANERARERNWIGETGKEIRWKREARSSRPEQPPYNLCPPSVLLRRGKPLSPGNIPPTCPVYQSVINASEAKRNGTGQTRGSDTGHFVPQEGNPFCFELTECGKGFEILEELDDPGNFCGFSRRSRDTTLNGDCGIDVKVVVATCVRGTTERTLKPAGEVDVVVVPDVRHDLAAQLAPVKVAAAWHPVKAVGAFNRTEERSESSNGKSPFHPEASRRPLMVHAWWKLVREDRSTRGNTGSKRSSSVGKRSLANALETGNWHTRVRVTGQGDTFQARELPKWLSRLLSAALANQANRDTGDTVVGECDRDQADAPACNPYAVRKSSCPDNRRSTVTDMEDVVPRESVGYRYRIRVLPSSPSSISGGLWCSDDSIPDTPSFSVPVVAPPSSPSSPTG
ncbi:hypothetical protein WN48_00858 [Eufriesea mexicana]|nr:hypothetical protein WN48_00858 [Eufriesea mexicana]